MNRVQVIYDISLQIKELLDQNISSKQREAVINELNRLIELRGAQMKDIVPPYTEEEKQLGKKLIPLNDEIKKKMQQLFTELKVEMKQVKKQKKSNQSYTNPYKSIRAMDGMFMDSKK